MAVKITDLISVEFIQELQNELSEISGMAILTTDPKGIPITKGSNFTDFCSKYTRKSPLGKKKCHACDVNGAREALKKGKPCIYFCHAGLIDFSAPIMLGNEMIACFVGGQIFNGSFNASEISKKAKLFGIPENEYLEAARKIPSATKEEILRKSKIIFNFAKLISQIASLTFNLKNNIEKNESYNMFLTSIISDVNSRTVSALQRKMTQEQKLLQEEDIESIKKTVKKIVDDDNSLLVNFNDIIQLVNFSGSMEQLTESEYSVFTLVKRIEADCAKDKFDDISLKMTVSPDVPDFLLGCDNFIEDLAHRLIVSIAERIKKGNIFVDILCKDKSYAKNLCIRVSGGSKELLEELNTNFKKFLMTFSTNGINLSENDKVCFTLLNILIKKLSGHVSIEENDSKTLFNIEIPQVEVKLEEI